MNYRHIYHAGNFADVFKHVIITLLIDKLKEKDKAFAVLDTHAGLGLYDLNSEQHQKTFESENGIKKLLSKENLPEVFGNYIKIVKEFGEEKYPGSPMIISQMLRSQDRLIASELHPDDYKILKRNFQGNKQVAIHHIDGYNAIKAFLPFKENRGLILIDPPYEQDKEFEAIYEALKLGLHRFRNGIFAIWYPIKQEIDLLKFHQIMNQLEYEKRFYEFMISDYSDKLSGTGMLIINPPYLFDEQIEKILNSLK